MKKKNDLISKLAIITAAVGIGSFIYKKVKKYKSSCNTQDPECYEDDSSFEIILDDDLEVEEDSKDDLEDLPNDEEFDTEDNIEYENKDA